MYVAVSPAGPDLRAHRRKTISRLFAPIEEGDYAALQEVLTLDAITRWPQSSEVIPG